MWDTAFHRRGIEYNPFLGQGQIFSLKADYQEFQPTRKGKQGKHPHIRRRRRIRPSQLQRLFHECQACWAVQLDPKRYGHCVEKLFDGFFEILDQSAKNKSPIINRGWRKILVFLYHIWGGSCKRAGLLVEKSLCFLGQNKLKGFR